MLRVSYEAIESAAHKLGDASADLGCGTPLGEITEAADETAAAAALDAVAQGWTQTLLQHGEQCLELMAAVDAAAKCYFMAEESIVASLQTGGHGGAGRGP
jgi:hypothetical protein